MKKNKVIVIAAGERKRIIHRVSNSIPASFHLNLEAANEDETLQGILEIETSAVLLDKKVKQIALEPEMTLHAGFWDAFYTVHLVAEQDVKLSYSAKATKTTRNIYYFALLIAVIALLVYLAF